MKSLINAIGSKSDLNEVVQAIVDSTTIENIGGVIYINGKETEILEF